MAAGVTDLDGDDSEVQNINKQIHVVNNIVDLIAKDSPTDGIRKLYRPSDAVCEDMTHNFHNVKVMPQVFTSTRNNEESPAMFARRFEALELDYLNHCDTATIRQDSQNFEMLLLENAKK